MIKFKQFYWCFYFVNWFCSRCTTDASASDACITCSATCLATGVTSFSSSHSCRPASGISCFSAVHTGSGYCSTASDSGIHAHGSEDFYRMPAALSLLWQSLPYTDEVLRWYPMLPSEDPAVLFCLQKYAFAPSTSARSKYSASRHRTSAISAFSPSMPTIHAYTRSLLCLIQTYCKTPKWIRKFSGDKNPLLPLSRAAPLQIK